MYKFCNISWKSLFSLMNSEQNYKKFKYTYKKSYSCCNHSSQKHKILSWFICYRYLLINCPASPQKCIQKLFYGNFHYRAIDKKRIDRELSTVIHAAYLVIERSPKQNWKLHSEWLLNFMDNKKGLGHGLVSLTSFELPANLFIDQLAVLLENSMNSFFQHPLHKKIKKSMEQYLDSSGNFSCWRMCNLKFKIYFT